MGPRFCSVVRTRCGVLLLLLLLLVDGGGGGDVLDSCACGCEK